MTCYNSELPIGPAGPTGPQGPQGIKGDPGTSGDGGTDSTLRYFGAIGDGITDDTVAVQEALNSGKGVLYGEVLNYLVSAQMIMSSNTCLQDCNFIVASNFNNGELGKSVFLVQGTLNSGVIPTANISEGSYTIDVPSGTAFLPGDLIFIKSDTIWSTTESVKYGEIIRIESISSNTLYLETQTLLTYTSTDNFTVSKINTKSNIQLINVSSVGTGVNTSMSFCRFEYAENIFISNGVTYNFDYAHYFFRSCLNYLIDNVNMKKTGVYDGLNYGVLHGFGSVNGTLRNSVGSEMRHLSTIGGSQGISRFITVIGCKAFNMAGAGIDSHSAVYEHSFINNDVIISNSSESAQDGIISQGGKPIIKGNRILNSRRHGIFWQSLIISDFTSPIIGVIESNQIDYNQSVLSTSYAILISPVSLATRQIDNLSIVNNVVSGEYVFSTLYIKCAGCHIDNVIISSNQFTNNPTTYSIQIQSNNNFTTKNLSIIGNSLSTSSITAYCLYVQGNVDGIIENTIISSNIINGGDYCLRLFYVDYVSLIGNMFKNFDSGYIISSNVTNMVDIGTNP